MRREQGVVGEGNAENWRSGHPACGRRKGLQVTELGRTGCSSQSPHHPASALGTQSLFNHEGSSFQMFSSEAYGQKNLLFKDSTLELVPIATQNYEAWLGQEYLHAMKGLLCDPNRESAGPGPSSGIPA